MPPSSSPTNLTVPRGQQLLGAVLIPAADNIDYIQGSPGYHALTPDFIRDAAVRARDEQLAYLAVHNRPIGAGAAGFSHIELTSHQRGYPALCQITGQPVGALLMTPEAVVGDLWLPDGTRQALTELEHRANSLTAEAACGDKCVGAG